MEPTVHATRATLAVGAFGTLAATAVARWAGFDGMNLPAQAIVVALVGSVLATFVVGIVRQWRAPGPWVTERERLGAATATSGRASAESPLARMATRSHPLLLLHASRALRCWPTEGEPW